MKPLISLSLRNATSNFKFLLEHLPASARKPSRRHEIHFFTSGHSPVSLAHQRWPPSLTGFVAELELRDHQVSSPSLITPIQLTSL